MTNHGIEILVAWRVGATAVVRLTNSTGSVDERFVETTIVRLIRFLVAEVPLAEDSRRVTGGFQDLRQRGSFERHAFAFENRVRDAVFHRMPAGH